LGLRLLAYARFFATQRSVETIPGYCRSSHPPDLVRQLAFAVSYGRCQFVPVHAALIGWTLPGSAIKVPGRGMEPPLRSRSARLVQDTSASVVQHTCDMTVGPLRTALITPGIRA
jgi:hypothetical protein